MAIKRYYANADNTITNAYKEDFNIRGTGSNMGQADIVEVFSMYAQRDSGSAEVSRALIKFPVSDVSADRTSGTIPASGSVSFYLKLYKLFIIMKVVQIFKNGDLRAHKVEILIAIHTDICRRDRIRIGESHRAQSQF